MSNLKLDLPQVKTYREVVLFFGDARQAKGPRYDGVVVPTNAVEIGYNTHLIDRIDLGADVLEITYQANPILQFSDKGIAITLAGGNAITTKDRLNKLQPVSVRSDYIAYVLNDKSDKRKVAMFAGKTMITNITHWYSFPWPPVNIVNDPEALAEWGRTVEALER